MAIVIDRDRCPQNHPCPSVRACPAGALIQKGFAAPELDESRCIGCKKCVRRCPKGVFRQA